MFCKHCGKKLDPNSPVCPSCGTAVSLTGGNGFWDIAGEPKRESLPQQTPPIVKEKVVVKEVKRITFIPIIISGFICLLCLISVISGRISAKKMVRELTDGYETQLFQQEASYKAQITQLESKIESQEEALSPAAAPGLEESANIPIRILNFPTAETKHEGYSNQQDWWLFRFSIEGAVTSFLWEKQQANGMWVSLEFDHRDIDQRYGIKIEQDLQSGTSKLLAAGLTSESDGLYRCTAKTDHGSVSVEVRLTVDRNSTPTPSPIPTDTPAPTPSFDPDPSFPQSDLTDDGANDNSGVDGNDQKSTSKNQTSGSSRLGGYHG